MGPDTPVGGVEDLDYQIILSFFEFRRISKSKERVAAGMETHLFSIDKSGGSPVDRPKMKQKALTVFQVWRGKTSIIPKVLRRLKRLFYTGETRFNRVGDKDLAFIFVRHIRIFSGYGVVP